MDDSSANWSYWKLRVLHWRSGLLITAVVVFGLILNLAVLGTERPATIVQAAPLAEVPPVAPTDTAPGTAPAVSTDMSAPIPVESTAPATELDVVVPPIIAASGAPTGAAPLPPIAQPVAQPVQPAAVSPEPTATPAPATTATTAAPRSTPTTAAPATTATPTTASPAKTATPTTAAPTTAAPTTAAPTTAAPTTAAPTTAAAPRRPATEYITYTVNGDVGQVVLAKTGSSISLYGFYPNANWVSQTESNGPRTVKLKFFNTQTQQDREWKATVEGSRIQVEN